MLEKWFNATGIQITILLLLIVIVAGLIVFVLKFLFIYDRLLRYREPREKRKNIEKLTRKEISELETRQKELNYTLPGNPLSGKHPVSDEKGLVSNVNVVEELRIFPKKKKNFFISTNRFP